MLSLLLIGLLTLGCDRASLYEEDPGLYENVKNTFDDCSEQDIAFLARKFNIQLAFTNCGTNNFSHFSWSPAGDLLYFQLLGGAFILNPESTGVDSLPSSVPLHALLLCPPAVKIAISLAA